MPSIKQITIDDTTYGLVPASGKTIHLVKGTQTASTASWTGAIDVDSLTDGLTIAYYLPYASASNATLTLTLSNSTTTTAIPVYLNASERMGDQYPSGSVIRLTYFAPRSVSLDGTTITDARWIGGDYGSAGVTVESMTAAEIQTVCDSVIPVNVADNVAY